MRKAIAARPNEFRRLYKQGQEPGFVRRLDRGAVKLAQSPAIAEQARRASQRRSKQSTTSLVTWSRSAARLMTGRTPSAVSSGVGWSRLAIAGRSGTALWIIFLTSFRRFFGGR